MCKMKAQGLMSYIDKLFQRFWGRHSGSREMGGTGPALLLLNTLPLPTVESKRSVNRWGRNQIYHSPA